MQTRQQFAIQIVQIVRNVAVHPIQIERDIAESRDTQSLAQRLQLRVLGNALVHRARVTYVVGDHLRVAVAPHLLQREPNLQGPESSRILRAEIKVVDRFDAEMIVRRMVGKCATETRNIAHQSASGFERCIKPLVRIDCDRIGFAQAHEQSCRIGRDGSQGTVGAVDMKPQIEFATEGGKPAQRINGSGADGASVGNDEKWLFAGLNVLENAGTQHLNVHSEFLVGGDPADGVGAEP